MTHCHKVMTHTDYASIVQFFPRKSYNIDVKPTWRRTRLSVKPPVGLWDIFCTLRMKHISKTRYVTKFFNWRYATHVDGWNQNLQSMFVKCGMFAIHVSFSSVKQRLLMNLVFAMLFVWSLLHNALTKMWRMLVFEICVQFGRSDDILKTLPYIKNHSQSTPFNHRHLITVADPSVHHQCQWQWNPLLQNR